MQIFVLALVLGIVAHDSMHEAVPLLQLTGWALAAWVVGTKVLVAVSYGLLCRTALRRLGDAHGSLWLRWLDRTTGLYRTVVMLLYASDLAWGGLVWFRRGLGAATGIEGGNLIAVDEGFFLLLPLAMVMWAWWCYYPVDRRLREATLIRRIDAGSPIAPIWTRWQFLLAQVRHQIALVLVPLLFLIGWSELVERAIPQAWGNSHFDPRPWVQLTGALCIFLFAPVMIRHLWDTTPLPDGPLRQRLMAMCEQYRVGVRELLLWRTFGGMINAAVMGLIRPLRFILLTDALIEQVPQSQVEAVMAHELAHVRRHHTFWLLMIAMVLMVLLMYVWHQALQWCLAMVAPHAVGSIVAGQSMDTKVLEGAALGGTILSWFVVFGWVSRRLERQADTFAVQHMAHASAASAGQDGPVYVNDAAVAVMSDALQRVADLNHMNVHRRSWRHGSIGWRQRYLRGLAGRRADRLEVDRHVFWIKVLTAVVAGVLLAAHLPTWF